MSLAKNQHWVPQFYLKHFAIPETRNQNHPWVWTLRLKDGYEAKRKIKKVAASDFLYSPLQADGTRCFRVDEKIGRLENDVAPFWRMIANGVFDLDGKQGAKRLISLFIATLHLRNPKWKDVSAEQHRELSALASSLAANCDSDGWSCQIGDHVIPIDMDAVKNVPPLDETALTVMLMDLIEAAAIEMADVLLEKRWLLAIADRPVFLTSDAPVVMIHRAREKFGFRTPGTEFFFPISPTRLLHIHDQPDLPGNQLFKAVPFLAAALNLHVAAHALEHVFSHNLARPVIDEAMRITDERNFSK